jgi:hypothetical protein
VCESSTRRRPAPIWAVAPQRKKDGGYIEMDAETKYMAQGLPIKVDVNYQVGQEMPSFIETSKFRTIHSVVSLTTGP